MKEQIMSSNNENKNINYLHFDKTSNEDAVKLLHQHNKKSKRMLYRLDRNQHLLTKKGLAIHNRLKRKLEFNSNTIKFDKDDMLFIKNGFVPIIKNGEIIAYHLSPTKKISQKRKARDKARKKAKRKLKKK